MHCTLALVTVGLALYAASAAQAAPATFYVATNGSDAWSGKMSRPNAGGGDGPFATIQAAQKAVRDLKLKEPARTTPIVVQVRGGTYELAQPLSFEPADSGSERSPVVYEAYPGERPVLSGGRKLKGWQTNARGYWELQIPEVERGDWTFPQLFVGGERRYRPSLPKNGYYLVADALPPTTANATRGIDRVAFQAGDMRSDWTNPEDIEWLGFQIWTMARMRVAGIDETTHAVTFTGTTRGLEWYSTFPKGNRYIVENLKEALSDPGEWYLDRHSGTLTYVPLPGESPEKTEVVAPRLEQLVKLDGILTGPECVHHIVFQGLTFAHTNWNSPAEGNSYPQAEVNLGGAIYGVAACDCAFEGCTVAHVGSYGIDLGAACKRNRIEGCVVTDLAAGGIKIGTTWYPENPDSAASHNVVRNCRIGPGGRMHPAGVGVWIGHSPYNVIEHNEIADFYYTGISVGWSWGYGNSAAHHNTLSYNHIHQIGQGVLSDMGGIYLLGVAPGTVVQGNLIHDVDAFSYGGWGIYPDEGSTDLLIRDNVVHRTKSAGFHQHYGKNNLVTNNVFAFGREAQVMRSRAEVHLSFTFEHNIVYWTEGPLLGSNWSGNNYKLDNNLYWNAAGAPITFAGMSLEQWHAKGQDRNSIIADPLFVDPAKGDFRLKPGSPAEKIGFQPIDVRQSGIQSSSRWARLTLKSPRHGAPRAFSAPPPPAAPAAIADDFDNTPVGETPRNATVSEENDRYTIRVTDETAASGNHSLKFTDGPGQQHEYNPHIYYDPGFADGTLRCSFDLRVEKGALIYHEWRDADSPYHVGPSVWILADGSVTCGGRRVAAVPAGKWVHFEIVCGLGAAAKGLYNLTITLPGRVPPIVVKGLKCDPRFRTLRWFGFTANGAKSATAYLDNLNLRPR